MIFLITKSSLSYQLNDFLIPKPSRYYQFKYVLESQAVQTLFFYVYL